MFNYGADFWDGTLATVKLDVKAFDIRLLSQLGMRLVTCVVSAASIHIGSGEIFGT
jgi:hypothetical protein